MANVAASGGYYVAAPAAFVVAEATTVTGSIGVVAARMSAEPLLSRLGIATEVVERGAHASLLSPTGPLDEEARATIARELDATYRAFIGVVASGRALPEDEVERLARGRIYTGKDALEAKLVDSLGGFPAAVEELRRRVNAKLEVHLAKPPRGPIPISDPPKQAARALLTALLPERERLFVELLTQGERVLALGPVFET
jgi:protease-4